MKVVEVSDIGEALRAIPGRRRSPAKPRAERGAPPAEPVRGGPSDPARAALERFVPAHPEELMDGWEPVGADELG
jgi:DNA repair protein RadA/Sms